jgi:hypothetical protein
VAKTIVQGTRRLKKMPGHDVDTIAFLMLLGIAAAARR